MVVVSRAASIALRSLELISAIIVAGIVGHYLEQMDEANAPPGKRFIYAEVVAGIAMLVAILLLIPFTWAISMFVVEFLLFILWIIAFGLLAEPITNMQCGGWNWSWTHDSWNGECERWKAALAFCFISAMLWLASAVLAVWVLHRTRKSASSAPRRGWFRGGSRV